MRRENVLVIALFVLLCWVVTDILAVVTPAAVGSTPIDRIQRDHWGERPMTEEELCKATILQWDVERCADF